MRRAAIAGAGAAAAALLLTLSDGVAQGTDDPGDGASLFAEAAAWLMQQQNRLHRALAADLREVAAAGFGTATAALIATSFLYGIFHAAGPGHGKVLLAAYLVADGRRARDGVGLAIAAAFVQGAVALALVYGLVALAGWAARDAQDAVVWSERLSYVLISGVGLALLARVVRRLAVAWREAPAHIGHGPVHDDHCGHVHAPTPAQIDEAADWRTRAALVLSIGLRPCTGAILVLVLAQAAGIALSGALAVLAMSAGTALAIALIAYLAVNVRPLAVALFGRSDSGLRLATDVLAVLGGATLLALGLSLLGATFAPQHPLGY